MSDFDTSKSEILEELKSADYHDVEDLVYRMQLTYDEIMDILDKKCFPSKPTRYTLLPRINEICDNNKTLECLIPDIAKVSTTTGLGSNLKVNQSRIFTKLSFFYAILGFTRSHSSRSNAIEGLFK